jgi:hypothetical protein
MDNFPSLSESPHPTTRLNDVRNVRLHLLKIAEYVTLNPSNLSQSQTVHAHLSICYIISHQPVLFVAAQ